MAFQDVDYVIFTGDVIGHATWATTIDSNREKIIYAFTQMKEKLSVPVLPILGNHESHPSHMYFTNSLKFTFIKH